MGCSFSLAALIVWIRHWESKTCKGLMQETRRDEIWPKPPPCKLLHGGFPARKWCLVALPTLLVLCHFELPPKRFGKRLLIFVVQRETCELCKGGKCACHSLDFFLLSASLHSLLAQLGFPARGAKEGRQPAALPRECVNSWSRGRDGPEALSAFHALLENEGRNEIPGTIYWRAVSQNSLAM